MGVPCITLQGKCHSHNVGVSLLTSIGLQADWVAKDKDEYVDIAIQAASDPQALATLRSDLRRRMLSSPLCDVPAFMSNLETRYLECFELWSSSPSAAVDSNISDGALADVRK